MPVAKKKHRNESQLRANEAKWGRPLVDAGWTLVPSTILERQQALGLDAVDLNILLQLARYWWKRDNPPHPKRKTIAECVGVSVSTVQRRIKRLERDGMIKIEHRFDKNGGQTSSAYHFNGLIKEATPYAQEAIAERAARKKEVDARRTRKALKRTDVNLKVIG